MGQAYLSWGLHGNPKPEEEESACLESRGKCAGFARTLLAVFSSLCTQEFAALVTAGSVLVHTEAGAPVTIQ